jgi:muconolactone delta-isomerase
MKYLVIGTPNQTPMPLEMAVNIYKAAMAWSDERLKNGKIESFYIFAERGGFSIAKVNSPEELFDELLSYPLYPFFDWEVTALVEWKHGYNSIIEFYKKMGAK